MGSFYLPADRRLILSLVRDGLAFLSIWPADLPTDPPMRLRARLLTEPSEVPPGANLTSLFDDPDSTGERWSYPIVALDESQPNGVPRALLARLTFSPSVGDLFRCTIQPAETLGQGTAVSELLDELEYWLTRFDPVEARQPSRVPPQRWQPTSPAPVEHYRPLPVPDLVASAQHVRNCVDLFLRAQAGWRIDGKTFAVFRPHVEETLNMPGRLWIAADREWAKPLDWRADVRVLALVDVVRGEQIGFSRGGYVTLGIVDVAEVRDGCVRASVYPRRTLTDLFPEVMELFAELRADLLATYRTADKAAGKSDKGAKKRRAKLEDSPGFEWQREKVSEYEALLARGLTQVAAAQRVKGRDGNPIPRPTLETWRKRVHKSADT
jgi:hypothetical protein